MKKKVLITGASGYVGGLLTQHLHQKGYQVRCFVRNKAFLQSKFPSLSLEIVEGDILDKKAISQALEGIDCAFYLIHFLGAPIGSFEKLEEMAARNFAQAADETKLSKIIYLGGLAATSQNLSKHLKSRKKVGDILRSSQKAVIEFQASIILGVGSLSFELMKALVERLPIMIAPKWVNTHIQPIYVTDVLAYLTQAINVEAPHHLVVGIGGKDIITFKELMLKYAQLRSLKRTVIVVPFLTPYLSSLWLGLVTPIYARIGRKLIESIYNETVVVDKTNLKYFTVSPLGYKEALKKCLEEEKKEEKTFSWTDAQSSIGLLPKKNQSTHKKEDEYHIKIKASLEQVFAVIERFWQTLSPRWIRFLWFIRASIDLVIGGVGLKRQRRSYKSLRVGDVFGVWRVVSLEKNKAIMLKAEMKLPGDAYLHIELEPLEKDVLLRQKLVFYPRGFWGLCYWYIVYPFHFLIFQSECKKIKEFSEKL